jgi:hypothetical protein
LAGPSCGYGNGSTLDLGWACFGSAGSSSSSSSSSGCSSSSSSSGSALAYAPRVQWATADGTVSLADARAALPLLPPVPPADAATTAEALSPPGAEAFAGVVASVFDADASPVGASLTATAAPIAAVVALPNVYVDTSSLASPLRLHTLTATSAELAARFGHLGFGKFLDALQGEPTAVDDALVDLVNDACAHGSTSATTVGSASSGGGPVTPETFAFGPQVSTLAYPELKASAATGQLGVRLLAAKHFNARVAQLLPLVDLRLATQPGTLAASLVLAAPRLWLATKLALWRTALRATAAQGGSGGGVEFPLNRHTAADVVGCRTGSDRVLLASVFGQLFAKVHHLPPSRLRLSAESGARAWRVNLVGEGSIDAGGPYRESLSDASSDLMAAHVALFVPCANRRAEADGFVSGLGGIHNMDKYVPNPSRRSGLHAEMFRFAGKLLGLAVRSGAALPLHFPPLFYKRLLGLPVGRSDLKRIDKFLVDYLDAVARAPLDPGITPELFEDLYGGRCFTAKAACGKRQVELLPGGARLKLTLANAETFVRLMFQYHLHEFDSQVRWVAAGLATVVPLAVLRIFTPSQLELLVTGRREVDLGLLQRKTTYEAPYSATHPTIVLFWQMMEKFSHAERSMLLKFAWSRDRLPLRAEDFSNNFKLTLLRPSEGRSPDDLFPMAHTCFFTVDLPEYTSLAAMTAKCKYAIENCTAIDIDGGGGGFEPADSGDSDSEEQEE